MINDKILRYIIAIVLVLSLVVLAFMIIRPIFYAILFGLILGIINGPLIILPEKKAEVSLIKESRIIKKNKFLSKNRILKPRYKIENIDTEKKIFLYFLRDIKKKLDRINKKINSFIKKKPK